MSIKYLRNEITGYQNSPNLQRKLVEYVVKILFKREQVEILRDIFTLFDKIEISETSSIRDKLYWWSALTVILSDELRKNPLMRRLLLPVYAQSEIGHTIFFERFFDFDCLVRSSVEELDLLARAVQTIERLHFAHFMKFMRCFLIDDKKQCTSEYEKIRTLPPPTGENPLSTSYYFISQLIYQSAFEKRVDQKLLAAVYQMANKLINNGSQKRSEIPTFEFGVIFALHFGKMSKEIINLSNYVFENYELTNLQSSVFYQLFLSVYARALLVTGEEERAVEFYKQVKFKHLNFPRHMTYYMKIRLMLIKAEFLIHKKELQHAKRILDRTKTISLKLQFHHFYHEAFELDAELEQKQLT